MAFGYLCGLPNRAVEALATDSSKGAGTFRHRSKVLARVRQIFPPRVFSVFLADLGSHQAYLALFPRGMSHAADQAEPLGRVLIFPGAALRPRSTHNQVKIARRLCLHAKNRAPRVRVARSPALPGMHLRPF